VRALAERDRLIAEAGAAAAKAAKGDKEKARLAAAKSKREFLRRQAAQKRKLVGTLLRNLGAALVTRPPSPTSLQVAVPGSVFSAGDERVATVRFAKAELYRDPLTVAWELRLSGYDPVRGEETWRGARELPRTHDIPLAMPTVADRVEGALTVIWRRGHSEQWRQRWPVSVVNPRSVVPRTDGHRITVWERGGVIGTQLDAL
jgi:hypothetical protein